MTIAIDFESTMLILVSLFTCKSNQLFCARHSFLPMLFVRSLILIVLSFECVLWCLAVISHFFICKRDHSAMHPAAIYGHPDVIRLLVSHGAELNAANKVLSTIIELGLAALPVISS